MISDETIQKAVELLREAANPRKIILFGSYARGEASEDSDLDILVLEEDGSNAFEEMSRLRRVLGPLGIPSDVIVASEEYYDYWRDTPGNLMFEVALEGRVVYDAQAA